MSSSRGTSIFYLRLYGNLESGRLASIYEKDEEAMEEKTSDVLSLVRSIWDDLDNEIAGFDGEASRGELESLLNKTLGR